MKQKHFPKMGDKYNDWEVIDDQIYKVSSNRASYWKVRCKCGYETLRCSTHLTNLRGKACKSCVKRKNTFEQSYLNRVKARAEKSKFEFNLDVDYIVALLKKQGHKCSLSGIKIEVRKLWHGDITQTASLDRIDNTKGYIKGNVIVISQLANCMKSSSSPEELKQFAKWINKEFPD